MSQRWYFLRGGQSLGPVPVERLQAMARGGELSPQDLVVPVGATQWIPAGSVPGLFPQPAAPPVVLPPRVAPPRAAPAMPVAPLARPAVFAQVAAPPPPSIEVVAESTFDRYQYESFRSVRDDLSRWITFPALAMMALHAATIAALPCYFLYNVFILLQSVESYSRVAWGNLGVSLGLTVVIPVLIQIVQFRIARGLTRGERSAAYGLVVFMFLFTAGGAALVLLPAEQLPFESPIDPRILGGILLGFVCLLQLPALVGAIREWEKFE
jgi:hypothetical protein